MGRSDNRSIIIPIILVMGYSGVLIYVSYNETDIKLLQDSTSFESMLETMKYFLEYADMKYLPIS